jgi:hypothetical protein
MLTLFALQIVVDGIRVAEYEELSNIVSADALDLYIKFFMKWNEILCCGFTSITVFCCKSRELTMYYPWAPR